MGIRNQNMHHFSGVALRQAVVVVVYFRPSFEFGARIDVDHKNPSDDYLVQHRLDLLSHPVDC
jgi:hypothetical protein